VTFAYDTLAFPMLTGSFVTAAGFVPIGFARSSAGEYTFSIFAVVTIALIVSWFVVGLFAPFAWSLATQNSRTESGRGAEPYHEGISCAFADSHAPPLDDCCNRVRIFRRVTFGSAVGAQAILSGLGPSRAGG
jgi:multidrug efflux pump subunit AcrB